MQDRRGYDLEKDATGPMCQEAQPSQRTIVDSVFSRRNTAMSALLREIAIIHGYQIDSSSKHPAPSRILTALSRTM